MMIIIRNMFRRKPSHVPLGPQRPLREEAVVNPTCSEFEVNNWKISEFLINQLVPVVGVHPFPINELFLMVAVLCRLKPTHIFEWGTHIGKSARIFYETSRYFSMEVEIHSIDLPDDHAHQEHPGRRRAELVRNLDEVHLYQGDGLTVSLELVRQVKPQRPLFFIDGDHDFITVERELRGVMENVPSANVLLHDTFYQSPESGYNIGPHRAIVEVLSSMPNKYRVISASLGLPGMSLLYQV